MIKINLKNILKEKKMTLKQLSDLTGISSNTLSALQNQKKDSIHFPTLDKVTTALDIKVEDLILKYDSLYEIKVELLEDVINEQNSECIIILQDIQHPEYKESFRLKFNISSDNVQDINANKMDITLENLLEITKNINDKSLAMKLEYDITDLFEIVSFLIYQELINKNLLSLNHFSYIGSYLYSNKENANKYISYLYPRNDSIEMTDTLLVYKLSINIDFKSNIEKKNQDYQPILDSRTLEFNTLVHQKEVVNNIIKIIID